MRIKRIFRNVYLNSGSSLKRKLGLKDNSYHWSRGDDEEITDLNGIGVESERQLITVLQSICESNRTIVQARGLEDGSLAEDESRELPNQRFFEALTAEVGLPPIYYVVEFDPEDDARREQVSLTLSSHVLRHLRQQAEKNSKPLSRYIDDVLASSLSKSAVDYRSSLQEHLAELKGLSDRLNFRWEEALKQEQSGLKRVK